MPKPALQIITSSRPNRSTALRDERVHVGFARDVGRHRQHLAAGAADLVGDGLERSRRRAQMTSAAPSRASRTAVARPMPADAPVMTTTLRTVGG